MKNHRLSELQLWEFLKRWDSASYAKRDEIIKQFEEDYTSITTALDFDYLFSNGASLILTRFVVSLQLCIARKRKVSQYLNSIKTFVSSLQGERYIMEFSLMGAVSSIFEIFRIQEMDSVDKIAVFKLLVAMMNGCSGKLRFKDLILSDNTYLGSVVDNLTSCKDDEIIQNAKVFFENLIGNCNISLVSKHINTLANSDFNPKIQTMAISILPLLVNQNQEIGSYSYFLIIDALKSDFNDEMLVFLGELSITLIKTSIADELIKSLIETATSPLNENLDTIRMTSASTNPYSSRSISSLRTSELGSIAMNYEGKDAFVEVPGIYNQRDYFDPKFQQQYGALFVISYILKNRMDISLSRMDIVGQFVDKGIVGCILGCIGTTYTPVQMSAIRILLLINDLSTDCSNSLPLLTPQDLLTVIINEGADVLHYLTASMCLLLRKIGRLVHSHWIDFLQKMKMKDSFSKSYELRDGDDDISEENRRRKDNGAHLKIEYNDERRSGGGEGEIDISRKIRRLFKELEELIKEKTPFQRLVDKMEPFNIGESFKEGENERVGEVPHGIKNKGEMEIFKRPNLEPFRKYVLLEKTETEDDEFEKYYISKLPWTHNESFELGAKEEMALIHAQKTLEKYKKYDKKDEIEVEVENQEQDLLESEEEGKDLK